MKELGRIVCNTTTGLLSVGIVIFPGGIAINLQCEVPIVEWFIGPGTNSEECSVGVYLYKIRSDVNEIAGKIVLIN